MLERRWHTRTRQLHKVMTTDRTGGPRQGPLASQGCVPFMARALLIALLLANGCGISNGRPSDVPSSARLPNTSPTETAGDSSGDDDAAECLVLRDSSPASTSGQINFRTKTRNGLRGTCAALQTHSSIQQFFLPGRVPSVQPRT